MCMMDYTFENIQTNFRGAKSLFEKNLSEGNNHDRTKSSARQPAPDQSPAQLILLVFNNCVFQQFCLDLQRICIEF